MAALQREVLRLDGGAPGAVDLLHRLGHLVEVREVLERRAAAPSLQVGHERGAVDRGRDHVVAPEHDRAGLVAGLELEGRGRLRDLLEHEGPFEADPVVLDSHPGLSEEVARPLVEEVDPDLFEDGHRLLMDGVDLFL